MFQVVEVNCLTELKTYQRAWDELWERGRCKSFQTTYDWLVNYWEHSAERELKVLVASLAGKVIGILPLVKKTVSTKLGNQRILTYPLDGWGSWYGPIGPNTAATLTAGLRYLSQAPRDWDLVDLPYIDRDRFDLGRTQTAARNMGWGVCERIWETIPVISLAENWTDFLFQEKESVQEQIFLVESLAEQLGNVRLLRYRSEQTPGKLRPKLDPKAAELLKLMLTILPDEENSEQARQLQHIIEASDSLANLDLAVCLINGEPVMASLGFQHRDHLEMIRLFLKPNQTEIRKLLTESQLQTLFLGRLLEDGTIRGDKRYEIAPGFGLEQSARQIWATELMHSFRNTMAPMNHLRGSLLVKYHSLTSRPIPRKKLRSDESSLPSAHLKLSVVSDSDSDSDSDSVSGSKDNTTQTLKLFRPAP